MKTFFCFAGLLLFFSCKSDPVPPLPLQFQGFDNKLALVVPSGVFKIKMNQPVAWRSTGGTVTQGLNDTLIYTAPATAGMQQVVIKPQDNAADSLLLTIAVTPSAVLFKSLREGNHVLVFRHAAADVGTDLTGSAVPNWWRSCDAKMARQLNNQGMNDAANTGKTLKLLDIPVGRVIASEYCRAFTTAEQLATGLPVQQAKELTLYVYDEPNRCTNTLNLVSSQPRDNKNSIFITHTAITETQSNCAFVNKLAWGDAAVFALNADKTIRYAGTIPVRDWTDLVK